jgi:HTH-type transcriptional regulator/antitoxin HigA
MTDHMRPARHATPPGRLLEEELEARGWGQTDFAEIIGRPPRVVNEIIAGKRAITPATAKELAAALGTSAELWLTLEGRYQLARTRIDDTAIARRAALRGRYPVREMIRRGWIGHAADVQDEEAAVLGFFGVRSVHERPRFLYAAHRTNPDAALNPVQEAWICRVRQLAQGMRTVAWTPARAAMVWERLRVLRRDVADIRQVPRVLEEAGIRLVIVEAFPGSRIDGVCLWLSETQPVIGLTLRFDRLDHFWFYLAHELEHVVRGHGKDAPMLDSEPEEASGSASPAVDTPVLEEEQIANTAAAEFCVPHATLDALILRGSPHFSEAQIVGVAKQVGVHPALVIGQLHRRLGQYTMLRKHLVKIRHLIAGVAPTDGFGHTSVVATPNPDADPQPPAQFPATDTVSTTPS